MMKEKKKKKEAQAEAGKIREICKSTKITPEGKFSRQNYPISFSPSEREIIACNSCVIYYAWLRGYIRSIGSITIYRDYVFTMGEQHYFSEDVYWRSVGVMIGLRL